jgi:O-antigen/teichoic acid export membrane protein
MRRASLLENSSWNVGAYVFYTVLAILSAPLYIRFLGIRQYGILVLLNTVIAPLGLLNMGMGQAAVKYISECFARKRPEEANGYLQSTLLSTAVIGGMGVFTVMLAARVLTTRTFAISPADREIATAGVRWVTISWFLTQISAQFTGVPTALQRYSIVSTGSAICNAITLGVGLLALSLGGTLLTLLQIRTIWTGVTVIGWCLVAKHLMPSFGLRPRITWAVFSKCMRFGIWQTVGAVGGVVANNADKALLGMYVSDAAVGLFAIPQTIVNALYSLTNQAADVLLPAISEVDSSEGRDRAIFVTMRVGWLLSVLTTSVMACLVVFGRDVLRVYMGPSISGSCEGLLTLIAVTAIASSGSVAITQYLLGIGNTRWTAMIALASGAVGLVGGLLLIPRFGLTGAAWSDLAAIALVRPIMHSQIWRKDARTTRPGIFAAYLYGPAMIGIPLCLALRGLRHAFAWNAGILGVAIGCGLCFLMVAGTVVAFDRALPGCRQRQRDVREALTQMWNIRRQAFRVPA